MPVWHEAARKWVEDGRLVLLGITQEQHADRCRLFAQWKGFGWPILHDPINVMQSQAVPILVAIDEHGIVRDRRPQVETFQRDFLDKEFADDAPEADEFIRRNPLPPSFGMLGRRAGVENSAEAWRNLGDALGIWGGPQRVEEAIAAYAKSLELEPKNGNTLFRLGVCFRKRHESESRRHGDFQWAVAYWGKALAEDPNQYIWRRRIEQYGPRLIKPYPFYDWVEQAAAEIAARGEEPVHLAVQPYGAEIAAPSRRFAVSAEQQQPPDPDGKINRDKKGLIEAEVTVVPRRIAPGTTARIHVTLHPNRQLGAHWNNEAAPLLVWLDAPGEWKVSQQLLTAAQPPEAESSETRRVDCEVQAPAGTGAAVRLKGYALYFVCEEADGVCRYLRQDIEIPLAVDEDLTRPQ